jgi:hypothetical protein
VRSYLDNEEAQAVFAHDPVERGFDLLRRPKKWAKREHERPPSDDLPSH